MSDPAINPSCLFECHCTAFIDGRLGRNAVGDSQFDMDVCRAHKYIRIPIFFSPLPRRDLVASAILLGVNP